MSRRDMQDDIGAYKGIKKIAAYLCIKLYAPMVRILYRNMEQLRNETQQMHEELKKVTCHQYESLAQSVRNMNSQLEAYGRLAENVRNINRQMEGWECIAENVRNINSQLEGYGDVLKNIRNNNDRLEKIDSTMDMYAVKLAGVQKAIKRKAESAVVLNENNDQKSSCNADEPDDPYCGIDYFDFENRFRGSGEQIKKNQQIYLKYFMNRKHVLDLGCGRGEFLELLKENGIPGYGADLYQEFVDLCISKQLKAVQADAIEFLKRQAETDGIFAGQLIEHLSLQQLILLIETAYEKLKPGAYLVLETPNPMSLAIYTNSFYMDPSHNKPVHPLTMKYLLEKAGFCDIDIIFTKSSRLPVKIPALDTKYDANMAAFNTAMQEVEHMLYGSQDYAIIARR